MFIFLCFCHSICGVFLQCVLVFFPLSPAAFVWFCLFKFRIYRLQLVTNSLIGELLYLCFVIEIVIFLLYLCFVFSNFNYSVSSLLPTVSLVNFCICVFVIEIVVLFMCLCFVYSNSKYHRLQLVANSLTGELLPRHLLVLASIQPTQDPVSPVLKVFLNKQNSCLLKAPKYSKYCRRVAKKIRNSLNSR